MEPPMLLEKDEKQTVPVRGTCAHMPKQALSRMATFFSVPPSSVHTLRIDYNSRLYQPVLTYVAALESFDTDRGQQVFVTVSKGNTASFADDDDDTYTGYSRIHRSRASNKSKGKEDATLIFSHGLDDCVSTWPPPANMAHISSRGVQPPSEPAVNGPVVSSTKEWKWPTDRRQLVYVVHYTTYSDVDGRHIVIGGVSQNVIRSFTENVFKMTRATPPPDSFTVRRFDSRWYVETVNRLRPKSSIVLPNGQLDEILSDVRDFLDKDTRDWYYKHALPHRRCLLFHGPPGTGKTSTICAIASELDMDCCFLSLTHGHVDDFMLSRAFKQMPANALLVIEDVDSLFVQRENRAHNALSFSGLLNSLDGVSNADGLVTVLTTNHVNKLDDALLRGGRVDRRFCFGPPGPDEVARAFRNFYPDCAEAEAREFADKIAGRPKSDKAMLMTTLQEFFIKMRRFSAKDAVSKVGEFFDERSGMVWNNRDAVQEMYFA